MESFMKKNKLGWLVALAATQIELAEKRAEHVQAYLEKSGAAPTSSDQTGLFGLKGKASQAVVLIYYK